MTHYMQLRSAQHSIPIGSKWLHKKGGRYVVVGHGIDTDTLETRIQYRRYDGPGFDAAFEANVVWSRPYHEWSVDRFVPIY